MKNRSKIYNARWRAYRINQVRGHRMAVRAKSNAEYNDGIAQYLPATRVLGCYVHWHQPEGGWTVHLETPDPAKAYWVQQPPLFPV